MSKTFTKLFASITESTVWCEPDSTRIAWITMLAMADHAGRIFASVPGLANRARVSIEAVEAALQTFLSPDRYSRTSEFEGRRVELIDGGWRLLNHEKYRNMRDEESVRETKRKWAANKRKEEKKSRQKVDISRTESNSVDRGRPNADASTEAELIQTHNAFDSFWEIYTRKVNKPAALKAWKLLSVDDQTKAIQALTTHVERWVAAATEMKFIPYPATWINAKRWLDEETPSTIKPVWEDAK